MAENKDARQRNFLSSFPLLTAANLLFFCFEFILAIEARSASLFSDSIVFLEGACVSTLMSSKLNWGIPSREAFARFCRCGESNSDLLSVLDDRRELLRGRDTVRDAAGHNRCGAPADQHRLSCHAKAQHV